MTFARRYQLKLGVMILLTIMGVATLVIGANRPDFGQTHENGFIMGIGTGLSVAGLIVSIKFAHTLIDPTRLKKAEIEFNDERNKALKQSAAAIAMTAMLIGMYALAAGLTFFGQREAGTLILWTALAGALLYCVVYGLLRRVR